MRDIIPVGEIPVINAQKTQEKIRQRNLHGFFNEIYDVVAQRAFFHLQTVDPEFRFSADTAGGFLDDKNRMMIDVPLESLYTMIVPFFQRHPDLISQYIPNYEEHLFGEPLTPQNIESVAVNALFQAGDKAAANDPQIQHTNFIGLTEQLLADPEAKKKMDDLIQKMTMTIIHENSHALFKRLQHYYGLQVDDHIFDTVKNVFTVPQLKEQYFRMLDDFNKGTRDAHAMRQFNQDYNALLAAEIQKMYPKHTEDNDEPKAFAYYKTLYGIGIEEIAARLIEANMNRTSPEDVIAAIHSELYENSGYMVEQPTGFILPDEEEISQIIRSHSIKDAYHIIMKSFYSDTGFLRWVNKHGVHLNLIRPS